MNNSESAKSINKLNDKTNPVKTSKLEQEKILENI